MPVLLHDRRSSLFRYRGEERSGCG
jgi:hypothetical protein